MPDDVIDRVGGTDAARQILDGQPGTVGTVADRDGRRIAAYVLAADSTHPRRIGAYVTEQRVERTTHELESTLFEMSLLDKMTPGDVIAYRITAGERTVWASYDDDALDAQALAEHPDDLVFARYIGNTLALARQIALATPGTVLAFPDAGWLGVGGSGWLLGLVTADALWLTESGPSFTMADLLPRTAVGHLGIVLPLTARVTAPAAADPDVPTVRARPPLRIEPDPGYVHDPETEEDDPFIQLVEGAISDVAAKRGGLVEAGDHAVAVAIVERVRRTGVPPRPSPR